VSGCLFKNKVVEWSWMDGVKHHTTPQEATWDALILVFLAEIGDKSFWATAVLSVWCPLNGLRDNYDSRWSVFFVFLGSFSALCLRTVLCKTRLANTAMPLDCFLNLVLLISICGVARQVSQELNFADERERLRYREEERQRLRDEEGLEAREAPVGSSAQAPIGGGFLGGFKPYSPPRLSRQDDAEVAEGYGAAGGASGGGGIVEEEGHFHARSSLLAFLIPLIVVFTIDANDKSIEVISNICGMGGWVEYGIFLGCFLATLVAIISGHLIESMMSEQRKLFLICVGLVALSLALVNDAVLVLLHHTFRPHLNPTNPSPQPDSVAQGGPTLISKSAHM